MHVCAYAKGYALHVYKGCYFVYYCMEVYTVYICNDVHVCMDQYVWGEACYVLVYVCSWKFVLCVYVR